MSVVCFCMLCVCVWGGGGHWLFFPVKTDRNNLRAATNLFEGLQRKQITLHHHAARVKPNKCKRRRGLCKPDRPVHITDQALPSTHN